MKKSWVERAAYPRRNFLHRLLRLAGLPLAVTMLPLPVRAAARAETIRQPLEAVPQHFMQRAYAMKRIAVETGDQGYGAVVVKDALIVGQAPSRVIVNHDPTAHAEMEAIRDAARRLGTRNLSGCVMYSSSRPCPMCQAAAYWAQISQLFYGTEIVDGGPPRLPGC